MNVVNLLATENGSGLGRESDLLEMALAALFTPKCADGANLE